TIRTCADQQHCRFERPRPRASPGREPGFPHSDASAHNIRQDESAFTYLSATEPEVLTRQECAFVVRDPRHREHRWRTIPRDLHLNHRPSAVAPDRLRPASLRDAD